VNHLRYLAIFTFLSSLAFSQGTSVISEQNSLSIGGVSIVGWDSATGDLGVAFQSNILAAGGVACYAKASVGTLVLQGNANPQFGPQGLRLLEEGLTPQQIFDTLMRNDSDRESRQIGILDAHGKSLSFTGSRCLQYSGSINGIGFCVQGNNLTGDEILGVIANTFRTTEGELSDRLLVALENGYKSNAQKTPPRSAALLVVRDHGGYGGLNDRYLDLRVDGDSLPLLRLRQLYTAWQETYLFDVQWRTIDAFNRDRKFDNARAELKRVVAAMNEELRVKPDDPETLNRIAFALATHNVDRPRALELAQRASQLSPSSTIILNTLAECYYQVGRYDDAIALESQLVAKEPANPIYWNQLKIFKEAKEKAGH
jgi:uncharacterized Ntn-hydrolase superfamily protein